jgi:AbrB family looped-hinge helix DNA binding protein
MRVTTKGQVTIPLHIREKMGITKDNEIDFIEKKGKVYLIVNNVKHASRIKKLRGCAEVKTTTDAILKITREG